MELFAQICIGGAFLIGSIILFNHVRVTHFNKNKKHLNTSHSWRRQNEMIGRRTKK